MKAALTLGWRLAWGSARPAVAPASGGSPWRRAMLGRGRSLLVVLSSGVGALLLAGCLAVTTPVVTTTGVVNTVQQSLLGFGVGLPVIVMLASVARLSAASRHRRLTNLRLLGLPPRLTRLVAAAEIGGPTVAGLLVALLLLPGLMSLLSWAVPAEGLGRPPGVEPAHVALVAVIVLGLMVGLGASGAGTAGARAVGLRRGTAPGGRRTRAVVVARSAPLTIGLGFLIAARCSRWPWMDPWQVSDPAAQRLCLTAGIACVAVGIVAVVPLGMRLMAAGLVRRGGTVCVVAGRRLADQPAATTRVVGVLLVALFLSTAARAVVTGLENSSAYAEARHRMTVEQSASVLLDSHDVPGNLLLLREAPGLRTLSSYAQLSADCAESAETCPLVVVATCAELARMAEGTTGCVEGRPAWLRTPDSPPAQARPAHLVLRAPYEGEGPTVRIPAPTAELEVVGTPDWVGPGYLGTVLLPPTMPELATLLPHAARVAWVTADPGPAFLAYLQVHSLPFKSWSWMLYEETNRLRTLVELATLLALAIGLFTCAITFADRAAERRAEVVSLQLVGVPRRLLRGVHAWELGAPLALGSTLAIALGRVTGDTYLGSGWFADSPMPSMSAGAMAQVVAITVVACLALVVVTAPTAHPRIRPDLIRAA